MKNQGSLQMLVAMAICGTIGITVMASGQDEVSLIFYRCLLGAGILLLVCIARGYFSPRHMNGLLFIGSLCGGAALLANWYFLFSAYDKASIGIATAVYNTQPVIMIALGCLLFKERLTQNIIIWTLVSITGLMFISGAETNNLETPKHDDYLIGVLEALLAAVLYAVAALFARILKSCPPPLIALLQMAMGAIVLWPFANHDLLLSPAWNPQTLATVLLGVVHTGIMYILLYSAIQKIEAWRAASISFVYPALAILIDAAFLDVRLSTPQWFGIALILLGAAGINLRWKFTLTNLIK